MTETKHSPLPFKLVSRTYQIPDTSVYETEYEIEDADGNWIMSLEGVTKDNARFIILACNHFEEMREFIAIVESCSGWQKDSEGNYFEENGICPACVEDASKLLAKLKEADDE